MIDAHGPDMATCMLRDPLPPCATPRHTQSMPSRPHAGRNPPPTNLQVDHARCALNHYLRLPLAGDWSEADSGLHVGPPRGGMDWEWYKAVAGRGACMWPCQGRGR